MDSTLRTFAPTPPVRPVFALALLGLCALAGCRSGGLRDVDSHAADRVPPAPPRAEAIVALGQGADTPAPTSDQVNADILTLKDADFVRRSQAAQRLVAGGAANLEALGRAGPQPVPVPGSPAESTTAPVVAAILGELSESALAICLSSQHAFLRAAAARESGRRGGWGAVPTLIERLADPVAEVRESARAALHRITGEVSEPGVGAARGDLAERWRTWWRQEGSARASGRDTRRGG